jgi:thiosulfate/3-mercaptopyruvate sulfurtransferase
VLSHLTAAVATIVVLHGAETATLAPVSPRDNLLVSTEWLATHLDDPNLVLLHVGDPREYRGEHIAGARLITLRDISTPHEPGALSLEMLAPDELRTRLEKLGISDESRIVVYYGKDWVSPATRVVLTLDWIGLGERTSLLDGGMPLWKQQGRPVTNVVPAAAKTGRLTARPVRGELIVDHAAVQRSIKAPGVTIVDARAAMFYDGPSHGEHRAGHIPRAVNLPFNSVFGDDLRLLSAESLTTLFRKAGVRPGDSVVVYCHIGQQATAVIFAARSLGYVARLYDGSFDDWSARKELPVEGGRPGTHR